MLGAMSAPTNEQGHPGGYASQYNPMNGRTTHSVVSSYDLAAELQFPTSLATFDKMRADPQIAGVLEAIAQPVLNAEWDLDTRGVDENVVEFVRTELGLPSETNPHADIEHQGVNILEHIAEATDTMLWAGFFAAEQTYTVAPPTPAQQGLNLPAEVRHLRKLAPRPPRTIERIETERDGGLKAIVQTPLNPTDDDIVIPVKQLVFYSHKKLGAAWEGQSVLRPVYRPWAMKDMYLRLDLAAVDRHSSGYWRGKTNDKGRRDELFQALANLRNGDESTIVHDPDDEVELISVNGQLINIVERLNYLDQEIGKSALAMFLDLGHDNGARSLGETHLRVFYTKVKALAAYIARTITTHVIRDLVRLNFPEGTAYPRLTPGDLVAQQGTSAETLKALMDSGALTYDRGLEDHVRARHGMPALPTPPEDDPDAPAGTVSAEPDEDLAELEAKLKRAQLLSINTGSAATAYRTGYDPASISDAYDLPPGLRHTGFYPVTVKTEEAIEGESAGPRAIAASEGSTAYDRATALYEQLRERVNR